jgi:hypothetical protein
VAFKLSMVLEAYFHQLNRFFQCVSDFNGKLVVSFALVDHFFKMDVRFRRLDAFVAKNHFDVPGVFGVVLFCRCLPMPESVEVYSHQVWAGLSSGDAFSLQVEAGSHVVSVGE